MGREDRIEDRLLGTQTFLPLAVEQSQEGLEFYQQWSSEPAPLIDGLQVCLTRHP